MGNGVVRFGVFEADLRTAELRKHGHRLRVPPQSFQILAALLERPGELITRDELRAVLWSADTFVDFEHNLNAAVNRLRDALGDSAEQPRLIETLPRRGYRFIGQLTSSPAEGVAQQTRPTLPTSAPAHPTAASAHPTWRRAGSAAAALFVLIAAAAWWSFHREPVSYRIAVLPLRNLSAEPNTDDFTDGLTDEITRQLSAIDGLTVTSRTSSFVFKGRPRDMREVARQLNANLILEGAVVRERNRLRIDVDLVRARDDATLWSRRYDRELKDAFSVQDEISRAIVNELRLKYVGGQRRYDVYPDAYDLYLRTRSLADANDIQRIRQAIPLYEQVIGKDAGFAPAYAGLAAAYSRLRLPRAQMPDADQRMRAAAERAIELDPMLAEAYAALGIVQADDLAWSDAEHTFEHALRLDPNAAIVHQQFGVFVLLPEGKIAAAVWQLREAVALDPLSSSARYALAFGLVAAGAYDEALEQCRPIITAKPTDPDIVFQVYARAQWFSGRRAEAIRVLETLGRASHGFLGYAYAQEGRREEAIRFAKESDPAAIRHQALIAAGLGDKDGVFDALHRMVVERDFGVDLFPVYPEFAFVRDDPRMAALRRERHLPWPP